MFLWTTPIYRGWADYKTARVLAGTRQDTCTPLDENDKEQTWSRSGRHDWQNCLHRVQHVWIYEREDLSTNLALKLTQLISFFSSVVLPSCFFMLHKFSMNRLIFRHFPRPLMPKIIKRNHIGVRDLLLETAGDSGSFWPSWSHRLPPKSRIMITEAAVTVL